MSISPLLREIVVEQRREAGVYTFLQVLKRRFGTVPPSTVAGLDEFLYPCWSSPLASKDSRLA